MLCYIFIHWKPVSCLLLTYICLPFYFKPHTNVNLSIWPFSLKWSLISSLWDFVQQNPFPVNPTLSKQLLDLEPMSLWYFPFKHREQLATIILILHQESVVELCSRLVMSMSSESISGQILADLTAVNKATATCTNQLFSINPNSK